MGMGVFGKKPQSKVGRYFRNNLSGWYLLAFYCESVAPELTGHCIYWLTNDGDGLNAEDAVCLADVLAEELESGRCQAYADRLQADTDALPDEPCMLCAGTGKRSQPPQCGSGDVPCETCEGTGRIRPDAPSFYIENVRDFAAFLRHCGGFEIC